MITKTAERVVVSQNGWPVLAANSSWIRRTVIPGSDVVVPWRDGSACFLLAHLFVRLDREAEEIDGPIVNDWGWADRLIAGSDDITNHASATAGDYNANIHSLGRFGTWKNAAKVRWILLRYRGCIRWGGDYVNRKDEMHFELIKSLVDVEKRARALLDTKIGREILAANPGLRGVILS